jgi:hypothetical protein
MVSLAVRGLEQATSFLEERMSQQIEPEQRLHPLFRSVRTLGTWKYLWAYLLLGSATVLLVAELVEFGLRSHRTGAVLLILFFAVFNAVRLHQLDRATT